MLKLTMQNRDPDLETPYIFLTTSNNSLVVIGFHVNTELTI